MMVFVDFKRKKGLARKLVAFVVDPTLRLLFLYRVGCFFLEKNGKFSSLMSRLLKFRMIRRSSCYISFKSQLGENISFPHPIGIVIGDGVIIEDGVKIWQNVTIGSHGKTKKDKEYPILRSGVKVYAGAIIVGGVEVGEGATVGANSYVNKNVPPGAVVAGSPAKEISK
jgi:serine O-acetyltransferase